MAMTALCSGVMADQGITQLEETYLLPRGAKSVVAPNCVHQFEINGIKDGERVTTIRIELVPDIEEKSAELLGGTLTLMPPRDKPRSSESNSETAGGTVSGNPVHYSPLVEAISFVLGAFAGPCILILIWAICEEWKCRLFWRRGNK